MKSRRIIILIFSMLAFFGAAAQDDPGKTQYNIQGNFGLILNADKVYNFAYGGTAQVLIPATVSTDFVAGLKAVTNPFANSPLSVFKNGFNRRGDALNYLMVLTGLRLHISEFDLYVTEMESVSVYLEPKIGMSFAHGFAWTGYCISPAMGIKYKMLDMGLSYDGGIGEKKLNIKKKSYGAILLGIGVTF